MPFSSVPCQLMLGSQFLAHGVVMNRHAIQKEVLPSLHVVASSKEDWSSQFAGIGGNH